MSTRSTRNTRSQSRETRSRNMMLDALAVLVLVALAALTLALHLTRPEVPYNQQAASLDMTVRAKVLSAETLAEIIDESGLIVVTQELELEIKSEGDFQDTVITTTYNGMGPTLRSASFREGEQALVMVNERMDGQIIYQVADHVRWLPLGALALLFVVVTALVGRWQGLRALLGLALSALLIGGFILPQILSHRDAVLVTLTGAALLLSVTLYLIQGWNATAHAALIGMLFSLGITGLVSIVWTRFAFLTGFGSEETMYLQAMGVGLQMRGLMLAGIIIGTASVLDDVVLAQSVLVFELAATQAEESRREVYKRAMKVGVTHLASMINTLVLAYAATALPLLILFYLYPEPWYLTINRELIAEEIVRTLIGSLGLMLAVPLTTLIAAWAVPRERVAN